MERQVRFDSRFVGFIEHEAFPELTFTLCPFQAKQVAARGLRAQNLTASGDLKPLRDRLAGLTPGNWLGHEARNIAHLAI